MRFLDLDLDFFLSDITYGSERDNERLGSEYKPWSISKVRHFLEERCGLSHEAPVEGRTIESHEGVLDFWRTLIETGSLRVPFEVTHIDAHPDLSVRGGLYLTGESLYVDPEGGPAILKREHLHSGNYLTFAIAYGWIASLIWIFLHKHLRYLPEWDCGDTRSGLMQFKTKGEVHQGMYSIVTEREPGVRFKVLPWYKFRTSETFDYIALSKSPNFTPSGSDELIPVIEGYMRQI